MTEDIHTLQMLYNNSIGALTKAENATAALPYAKFLEKRVDYMDDISEE